MYLLSKPSRSNRFNKTIKFLNTHAVLLFENDDQVIIKYSTVEKIRSDYDIAHLLNKAKLPNFVEYICECKYEYDKNLPDILEKHPEFCNKSIVMPYYSLGSLNEYRWTQSNFTDYLNILKQACFALLYAYETIGFIHRNLHMNNILMKPTTQCTIHYGASVQLPIGSLYATIMDFENSLIIPLEHREECRTEVYKIIRNLLLLALNEKNNSQISFTINFTTIEGRMFLYNIGQFESKNPPITPEIYTRIGKYIDMIQWTQK